METSNVNFRNLIIDLPEDKVDASISNALRAGGGECDYHHGHHHHHHDDCFDCDDTNNKVDGNADADASVGIDVGGSLGLGF